MDSTNAARRCRKRGTSGSDYDGNGAAPPFDETVNYIQRFDDLRPAYTDG